MKKSVMGTKLLHILALSALWCVIFFSLPNFCTAHSHSHEDHHHHHEEGHTHERASFKYTKEANVVYGKAKSKQSPPNLWLEALSSTLIISLAPFFILFFVPLNNSKEHESLLKVLLSFASGGLLGDAFLHLIPHALMPHTHTHDGHVHSSHDNHSDVNATGLWILGGIVAFFLIEKSVRHFKNKEHDSTTDVKEEKEPLCSENECLRCPDCPEKTENDSVACGEIKEPKDKDKPSAEVSELKHNDDSGETEEIKVAGYLNLVADFAHNFTDGLAIGASYLAGAKIGLVTTVTILFHEVPHEIGDFAVLIQSGCSKKKAMLLQLVTAIGAFSGTVVSLATGGIDESTTSWVLPFTAGGFIYIATVAIIPELLTDTKFGQSCKEILALLIGVLMMVVVAQYE